MDFSLTEAVSISTLRLHSVVKGSIRSETPVITPPSRENGPIAFALMMEKLLRFMLTVSLKGRRARTEAGWWQAGFADWSSSRKRALV